MKTQTIQMAKSKDTKTTAVYQAVAGGTSDGGTPAIRTVYIEKHFVGEVPAEAVEVTVTIK